MERLVSTVATLQTAKEGVALLNKARISLHGRFHERYSYVPVQACRLFGGGTWYRIVCTEGGAK